MPEVVYEPEENSKAKSIAMEAIEEELLEQGFDPEEFDLIDLADAVVEVLILAGVKIPESLAKYPRGL